MKKPLQKKVNDKKQISAEDFDAKFEAGEDVAALVNWKTAKVVKPEMQRVAIDFPEWMVVAIDAEATRIGLTRQAILKVWVSEQLKRREAA